MKYRWDKKYLHWGITGFLVLASAIIFYYLTFHTEKISGAFSHFMTVCAPIIMGLVIAYLITPVCSFFENVFLFPLYKKFKMDTSTLKAKKRIRAFAVLLTYILTFYLLYIFFSIVLKEIIASIQSIILQFPLYVVTVERWANKRLASYPEIEIIVNNMLDTYSGELNEWLNSTVLPQLNTIVKEVSLSLLSVIKALWNLIIGFIISIYVLFSKERFAGQAKKIIYAFTTENRGNDIISDCRFANRTFGAYISGKIIDSIIIGFLCFILMNILSINYPVLISVIIGITNIIPFFGPFLGGVPCALLITVISPIAGLKFILLIILLQTFDGNVLGPKILGDSTGLSSFWVVFSITIFGAYWGILGMAIGVPIFALIYAAIKRKVNRNLAMKGLSFNTKDYMTLDKIENSQMYQLSENQLKNSRKKKAKSKNLDTTENDTENKLEDSTTDETLND